MENFSIRVLTEFDFNRITSFLEENNIPYTYLHSGDSTFPVLGQTGFYSEITVEEKYKEHLLKATETNTTIQTEPEETEAASPKTTLRQWIVRVAWISSVIALIVFIEISVDKSDKADKEYKRYGVITTANIYNAGSSIGKYSSISLWYEYYVNDIRYTGSVNSVGHHRCYWKFKGKKFPVIYLSNNPVRSKLLTSKSDFENNGLLYPDSLKWVKDYW